MSISHPPIKKMFYPLHFFLLYANRIEYYPLLPNPKNSPPFPIIHSTTTTNSVRETHSQNPEKKSTHVPQYATKIAIAIPLFFSLFLQNLL